MAITIERRTITPADAKRLVMTYNETPGMYVTSLAFDTFYINQRSRRKSRRHVNTDALICLTDTGTLVSGLDVLIRIIKRHYGEVVAIAHVDDAELVFDVWGGPSESIDEPEDTDMETFSAGIQAIIDEHRQTHQPTAQEVER